MLMPTQRMSRFLTTGSFHFPIARDKAARHACRKNKRVHVEYSCATVIRPASDSERAASKKPRVAHVLPETTLYRFKQRGFLCLERRSKPPSNTFRSDVPQCWRS